MKAITLNREKLKDALRPIFRNAVKRRIEAGRWTHANADAYFSPSQWWVDAQNGSVRHSLNTGISAAVDDNKINIGLIFEIVDIS